MWNKWVFILLTGFLESVTFICIKTVLILYIYGWLNYNKDESSIIFHGFLCLVGVFSLVGAFFADRWLGLLYAIIFLLILYAIGCINLVLATLQGTVFSDIAVPSRSSSFAGLLLIALGAGGIQTCVFALTADRYKMPKQARYLGIHLSWFSLTVFGGAMLSAAIIPVIREFKCNNEDGCFSAAFMLPTIAIIGAIASFTVGMTKFRNKSPTGEIFSAIDGSLNVNTFKNIVFLYLPLSFFWACFDQQGSRWTLQATLMDNEIWGFNIKPDQMQLSYYLLMLIFMPLIDYIIYPFLSLLTIRTPLQKIFVGGVFVAAAFIFATFLQLDLEKLDPVFPNSTTAQIRVYNGLNCEINVISFPNIDNQGNITIESLGMFKADGHVVNVLPYAQTDSWNSFRHKIDLDSSGEVDDTIHARISRFLFFPSPTDPPTPAPVTSPPTTPITLSPEFACENLTIEKPITEGEAVSYFFHQNLAERFEAHVEKPKLGMPIVRPLINIPPEAVVITLEDSSKQVTTLTPYSTKAITVSRGGVLLLTNGLPRTIINARSGGVYVLLGHRNMTNNEIYHFQTYETVEPNSINIVWQLPQYICLTLGEMFITNNVLAFSNSEAPENMQPILHGCWWLTRAIGNLLAMIIMKIKFSDTQAMEYLLFAEIMAILMIIFMTLAICYKLTEQGSRKISRKSRLSVYPSKRERGSESESAQSTGHGRKSRRPRQSVRERESKSAPPPDRGRPSRRPRPSEREQESASAPPTTRGRPSRHPQKNEREQESASAPPSARARPSRRPRPNERDRE